MCFATSSPTSSSVTLSARPPQCRSPKSSTMEMLKKLRVSRRFALQGAVGGIGVSLWLPILEAMCNDHGTAFAQGEPIPTSFGIFFRGNGHYPNDWTTGTGDGDGWQLPTNLEPFSALKADLT